MIILYSILGALLLIALLALTIGVWLYYAIDFKNINFDMDEEEFL